MSRRGVFGLAGGVGLTAAFGATLPWLARPAELGRLLPSGLPLPPPFRVPLPIPPVLAPRADATTDHYEIEHRVATREILPGVPTEIWGYDGLFPGPTIVSRSGRRTVVRHTNRLPVPTVVHLHGGHVPAESDGYPTDLILPRGTGAAAHHGMDPLAVHADGTRLYDYPMRQRAATLWYHDHRMDFTGPAVWHGLAGFHLIRDEEEEALPLPGGERDIPLMITDRSFAADGSLHYPRLDPEMSHTPGVQGSYRQGVLGDVVLVNGAPWPMLEVDAVRYRFRLLNASNARRYRLCLDPPPAGGRGLVQIGSDGGLLAAPIAHDSIDIAPAERFDVVVDFSRYPVGARVTLVNMLATGGPGQVMRFVVARAGGDDSRVPARLAEIERLDPAQAVMTRDFALRDYGDDGWRINGLPFDPARMDARPRLGDVEIWRFSSDFHHPVHLHLVHFQVLSRDREDPGPYDAGWKDTVDLLPGQQVTVIAKFTGHRGRFVFHCHNLEHEDMAMMANLEVT
jgi:spore coat protein A